LGTKNKPCLQHKTNVLALGTLVIQLKKSCRLPAVFSRRLSTQFSCRQHLELQDVKMTLGLLKEKPVTAHFFPALPLTLLHVLPSHDLLGRY